MSLRPLCLSCGCRSWCLPFSPCHAQRITKKQQQTNLTMGREKEGNEQKQKMTIMNILMKYFRFQFIILIRPQWIQWILPQQRSASQKWPSLSAHNMKENKPRGLLWKLFCACHGVRYVFPGRYTLLSHCL